MPLLMRDVAVVTGWRVVRDKISFLPGLGYHFRCTTQHTR